MMVVRAVRGPSGRSVVPWTSTWRSRVITDCTTSNMRQYTTARKPRTFALGQRIGRWLPEEDATLARLHGHLTKVMVQSVSGDLERSSQAVRRRYYRLFPIPEEEKPRPWTSAEDGFLRNLYSTRMSVRDIARKLGRERSVVHKRRYALGIVADRVKPHLLYMPMIDDTIVRMHKLNHTWRAVGAQLGLRWTDIRNRAGDHLKLQTGRTSAGNLATAERTEWLDMLRTGHSLDDIDTEFGIKESCLSSLIRLIITYRHVGAHRVRRHATALYPFERKMWRWREIGVELKTDDYLLSKVYAYSSFEVYKDLVDDEDPRLWDDAKLTRITKIVADRVTARNVELGFPDRKTRRNR